MDTFRTLVRLRDHAGRFVGAALIFKPAVGSQEVYELRRANEILKAASVFFATELDADRTK